MIPIIERYEDFYGFMSEYADFFDEMAASEEEKLDALTSNVLERIERSVATQQAMEKRMQALEKRRMELQEALGLGGMTFRQIIAQATPAQASELQQLFEFIEGAIADVKFLNGKSLEIVKMNLEQINARIPPQQRTGAQGYNAATGRKDPEGKSIFEKKI